MLMWSSVAASGFGDRLIQLAAWSMLGYRLEGAQVSSIQAGVSFFFFLPYVLLGPPGGWLADTLPRKWLMLFCDEARAGLLLLAYVLAPVGAAAAIPGDHHWKVYAIIAAVGSFAAIFSPTKSATIPQIVTTRQLQPANAIILGIAVIASMVGLMAGGPLIEKGSVRLGLITAVLCFGVSGTFFAFLKLRPHTGKPVGERPSELVRVVQAVAYIRRHRPVLELTLLSMLFWTAAHIFLAAVAALAKNHLNVAPEDLVSKTATLMATVGIGMLASSLWVAWANTRREASWFAMVCLLLTAACLIAMAINRSYHLALVIAFATGFLGNAAMICFATLTQSITPNYIRGRVFGVRDLAVTLVSVIVNFTIWRLPNADAWMTPALYASAGVLFVVAARGLWVEITRGPHGVPKVNAMWRLTRAYCLVWHRLRWTGRHHVPMDGPVILASNHPTGVDPVLIQSLLPRLVRWVMWGPYRFRLLNPLWNVIDPITVEHNESDHTQIRHMIRALKEGNLVGIFPEGGAQRETRELKPFQPGIGLIAKRSGATVVPVWVAGPPQTKWMPWHFLLPSKSSVTFGRPYRPERGMPHQAVADELREQLLRLSSAVNTPKKSV